MLDTPAVIAFGRLVVLGGDAQRIHEEIVSAGGTITEGRFRRFDTRAELDRVIDARPRRHRRRRRRRRGSPTCGRSSKSGVSNALDARERERTETLETRLAARDATGRSPTSQRS